MNIIDIMVEGLPDTDTMLPEVCHCIIHYPESTESICTEDTITIGRCKPPALAC